MEKYVYLYKITLKKKRKKPLYYFGIRVCQCLPEDDSYMGSPITHADLWNDESYIKTKEILKSGEYDTWFESFRDEEVEMIKEGWDKFGAYGKDENGLCLNAHAGKTIIFTDEVKARHKEAIKEALNRPDVKAKHKEAMNRPDVKAKHKELLNRPDVKAKRIEALNRPDVKAKRIETLNRPDVKARHKEAIKEALNRPDVKAKRKETWDRLNIKTKMSGNNNVMNKPDVKARHKEAMNRPDVKSKRLETCRRNKLLRQQQKSTLSLESFFT